MAASPQHIFAMKALAARTRDIDDLRLLAGIIGVESSDQALQICSDFYPDEPFPPDPPQSSGNSSAEHPPTQGWTSPMLTMAGAMGEGAVLQRAHPTPSV